MNRPTNDEGQGGSALYVINLDSSSMPMSLDVPFRHDLVGFTVFRSRSFEHGRERFRLHLGYFESTRHAEDALKVVRKYYPAALIAAAPVAHLGSLDNTANTEFRMLRTAYARVLASLSAPTAPAPVAEKVAASAPTAPAPVAEKVAASAPTAPEPAAEKVTASAPTAPAPVAEKVAASAPMAPAPVAEKVAATALLKEPRLDAPNRAAAPAVLPPPQHYAVQLEWSLAPITAAAVPQLAIFLEYHLYTVRMMRGGSPQQGLRLGFFTSAESAFRVAEYVRSEFPGVGVVPVSHREYARAIELTRRTRAKAQR